MPRVSSSFGPQASSFDYRTVAGMNLKAPLVSSIAEPALIDSTTVAGTAPNATVNINVGVQSIVYLTTSAGANWTVNFRGSNGTPLNLFMVTGQVVTIALMATQGATAYYNSAITIDGASITPKYQGGNAWTAGNASGVDIYTYTIVKTGNSAFTVFTSQTQFA
jgi:hypothetical protein